VLWEFLKNAISICWAAWKVFIYSVCHVEWFQWCKYIPGILVFNRKLAAVVPLWGIRHQLVLVLRITGKSDVTSSFLILGCVLGGQSRWHFLFVAGTAMLAFSLLYVLSRLWRYPTDMQRREKVDSVLHQLASFKPATWFSYVSSDLKPNLTFFVCTHLGRIQHQKFLGLLKKIHFSCFFTQNECIF